mgnify:CR=1 FL=1
MRIIRLQKVKDKSGYCAQSIVRKVRDPDDDFPAARQIGARGIGWIEEEIDTWIKSRAKGSVHPGDNSGAPPTSCVDGSLIDPAPSALPVHSPIPPVATDGTNAKKQGAFGPPVMANDGPREHLPRPNFSAYVPIRRIAAVVQNFSYNVGSLRRILKPPVISGTCWNVVM